MARVPGWRPWRLPWSMRHKQRRTIESHDEKRRTQARVGLPTNQPVGQREELHRFARDLVGGALLDDKAAGHELLANVFTEADDRAVGVPCDQHIAPVDARW